MSADSLSFNDFMFYFQQLDKEPEERPNRVYRRTSVRAKVRCDQCNAPIRLYNFGRHFSRVHPDKEVPIGDLWK
jgi:hypothetical protein